MDPRKRPEGMDCTDLNLYDITDPATQEFAAVTMHYVIRLDIVTLEYLNCPVILPRAV
jgi:hypothetical protein